MEPESRGAEADPAEAVLFAWVCDSAPGPGPLGLRGAEAKGAGGLRVGGRGLGGGGPGRALGWRTLDWGLRRRGSGGRGPHG